MKKIILGLLFLTSCTAAQEEPCKDAICYSEEKPAEIQPAQQKLLQSEDLVLDQGATPGELSKEECNATLEKSLDILDSCTDQMAVMAYKYIQCKAAFEKCGEYLNVCTDECEKLCGLFSQEKEAPKKDPL